MNYVTSGLDAAVPVVNITYSFDPNNNTLVNVTATAKINTSFIGLLPAFKTLNVSATAQGKAARVEMTLVLDRSGSMGSDGGSTYLPGAVSNFTDRFDDGKDSASLVTFSTTATTDVSMRTGNFQSLIKNTANSLSFSGHTFSDAALQQAFTQENVAVTGNVQKSVVFFTDGGANTIQNNLTCGSGSTLATGIWNFGGQDPGANGKTPAQTAVGFMNPNTGADQSCTMSSSSCCKAATFPSASQSASVAPAWTASGPASTPWSTGTIQVPLTYSNVQADALYRPIGDAIAMRKAGITVYSIGLGSAPAPADPTFLCQVANDPSCSPTYDATLPAGVMAYAQSADQLDAAFQTIANIIRLRLTQ